MLSEWISSVRLRLKSLKEQRKLDRDLREEMAFHLEMREQKLRSRGMEAKDAHHEARRAFGNLGRVEEDVRMIWKFAWLEQLGQDIRYAMRSLGKSPVLACVVVLSLALGTGANTAIFSLINAVVLRPLPVRNPQELVQVKWQRETGSPSPIFTNPLWEAFREQQDILSGVFAWSQRRMDLAQGGPVKLVNGVFVSGEYFNSLGVAPATGRLIMPSDDQRSCTSAAVLSYDFWRSQFTGSENVIGSKLSLDNQLFEVVGVSAPGFRGLYVGEKFDVAIPICSAALFDGEHSSITGRSHWWLNIYGRVKDGVSPEQLKARMGVLSSGVMKAALPQNWEEEYQKRFLTSTLVTATASNGTSRLRRTFGGPLNILMAIVGIVLLIACANIASLMMARATARTKEIAIRKALGASRLRLIRQLLTESLMLAVLGAAFGLVFARWGSALLVRGLSTTSEPVFLDLAVDARVLTFTAVVAIVTGILVGLLPALKSTGISLMTAMKGFAAGEGEGRGRFRAGKLIVGSQVALSLVLLIGGGLLMRSFVKLMTVDLGFDRNNVLLVNADLNIAKVAVEKRRATFEEIENRLRALPGALSVGRSFNTPLSHLSWNDLIHADTPHAPTGDASVVFFNFVSPGYFQTMRMQLMAGRDFGSGDVKAGPQVAIVNETLARKFFPGMNATGKRFRVEPETGKQNPMVEIVGVVKDSKYESMREEAQPTAFFPIAQTMDNDSRETFALRTAVPPLQMTSAIQHAVADVNKGIPLDFHTLSEQVDDDVVRERVLATLSGFFGGLALLLAMIGLYGVLSYLVTQRQIEFGIRMALGAQAGSILRLVMADVFRVLIGGVAVGIGLSLLAVRLLQSLLFGLKPRDAITMVTSVCVLCAIGLLAGYLPARRATKVDPMVALRYE